MRRFVHLLLGVWFVAASSLPVAGATALRERPAPGSWVSRSERLRREVERLRGALNRLRRRGPEVTSLRRKVARRLKQVERRLRAARASRRILR